MDSQPVNREPVNKQTSTMDESGSQFIGYLNILIHHARDIQNICIYHKQDVYAKVSLTNTGTDTGTDSVSTRTVNGGGRNPVFNESLRLGIRVLESSIKCEVWMLSRVKNYLQDQLLGLTLIPLSDLLTAPDNKLTGEFSLSSNDLFESPSGFVQLSLSYSGLSPEVIPIPPPVPKENSRDNNKEVNNKDDDDNNKVELEKIEFPDLELVKENQIMVSEYFGIPSPGLQNPGVQSPESLITTEESENPNSQEAGVRVVESFSISTENSVDSVHGGPVSSVSTTDKISECTDHDAEAESAEPVKVTPMVSVNMNMEGEKMVDQKEIMDMYMKSMQQFTESLAKMKFPMDYVNGNNNNNKNGENNNNNNSNDNNLSPSSNSSSSTSEKKDGSVKDKNSRVFYGSRAFF